MPMNKTVMATAIVSAIAPLNPNVGAPEQAQMQAHWEAICEQIILHIQANAQVVVASVSGVTAGGANSGPGTGTIL